MKKSIRLLGTTLLVTGMGIGGTALTAGAASADTGTQSPSFQVTGNSWDDGNNCWNSESWSTAGGRHNDHGDNCRDNGDHKHDRGDNGDHKHDRGDNGDHKHDGGDHKHDGGDHKHDGGDHKHDGGDHKHDGGKWN